MKLLHINTSVKDNNIINNLNLFNNINNSESSKMRFLYTIKFISTCNNCIREVESFYKRD